MDFHVFLEELDVSMKRFEYVHPAGGNEFTSVKITPGELEEITETQGWCDVCKGCLMICKDIPKSLQEVK